MSPGLDTARANCRRCRHLRSCSRIPGMSPILIEHTHQPVYRVIRSGNSDPLDAAFSQKGNDNRWNTSAFPALYCCCSERVARAVTLDLFRFLGVEIVELHSEHRPALVEISWMGMVADIVSEEGLRASGRP